MVGTSRCDVPARVQRAERALRDMRITPLVAPLNAARTAQRAVPTTRWNAVSLMRLSKPADLLSSCYGYQI